MNRKPVFVPEIVLERASAASLRRQIYDQIAAAIRAGGLARGGRLPSSRELARWLGVSRNTALAAYEDLVAAGLVAGERGSATVVSQGGSRSVFRLRRLLREANYPERIAVMQDPDGNAIRVCF
jgi:DNA-binding GntR family transcriptional regulator